MGTSSSYGGPGKNTPLVPTWLEPMGPSAPQSDGSNGNEHGNGEPEAPSLSAPDGELVRSPARNRFAGARNNFSRYIASGGQDRRSLGRAISHYVSHSAGGARTAAHRMGASRAATGRLLQFLSLVSTQGVPEALRTLRLESLAGRPIQEVFFGLIDYVCPRNGTIDEGIARDAFIETIVDLTENNITDLNALTAAQMETVMELYAAHAIEARLCNDIGSKLVLLPNNVGEAEQVQGQLGDFIRRAIADAFTRVRLTFDSLTPAQVKVLVDGVYEQTFSILQQMGEREANRE